MNFHAPKTFKLKLRTVKMGAVLTWAETPAHIESAKELIKLAPRVYILSKEPIRSDMGIFWLKAKQLGLRELMANYMTFIPGNGVVIIAHPETKFGEGLTALLEHVEDSKMGMAWAGYVRTPSKPDGAPKAFVMASSSLAYLLQDVPSTLMLDGDDWSSWMHARLANLMMRPRYFDASPFGIVVEEPKKQDILNAYDISPAPKEEIAVADKPKKRKKNG